MIKGENNIINDTKTYINMVDDDMNYLVKAMIMGETNIINDTDTSSKWSMTACTTWSRP